MGTTHTHIAWIEGRPSPQPALYPALAAYLAPFGFGLCEEQASADADVCLMVADDARQAYGHASFAQAKQQGKPILVLLITASAMDRVAVLDQGADDCMVMPIEQRELAARLQALRRRKQERLQAVVPTWIRFGPWLLDAQRRRLTNAHALSVELSNAEYRLLLAFLSAPYQVFSRDKLMDLARGRGLDAFERSIDLLVSRLRHKLGDDPRQPRLIQTVRGQGYVFNAHPNTPANSLPTDVDVDQLALGAEQMHCGVASTVPHTVLGA